MSPSPSAVRVSSSAAPAPTAEKCRWGILGTAQIAKRNWQAIRDAGNAQLVAVASRQLQRAQSFIEDCQLSAPHAVLPEAVASYEALLARADVDAIYIPLPTGLRAEWVKRAARAGKHVLVEKPIATHAEEAEEMIQVCAQHGVQFMDGVMFMHGARLQPLWELLQTEIGPVQHVATQFSFLADDAFWAHNIRSDPQLEPLGCLGDLGWYCIRLALWAMDEELPERVSAQLHRENDGVPAAFSGLLSFSRGRSSTFHCSFTAGDAQWAWLSSAQGLVQLRDFVLPFSGSSSQLQVMKSALVTRGCEFEMQTKERLIQVPEPSHNAPGSPESKLFRRFSEIVLSRQLDSFWPAASLRTQQVLDACLKAAVS
jgi:predicted dehydrogenase